MKALLIITNVLIYIVVLYATLHIANAIVSFYMVYFGYVQPGEPMYLDTLAPTIIESVMVFAVGISVIALCSFGSSFVKRRLKNAI